MLASKYLNLKLATQTSSLPVGENVDHGERAGHGAKAEPDDVREDVLVAKDLGLLVLGELAQEGVGLAQQQVDQEPEHLLKFEFDQETLHLTDGWVEGRKFMTSPKFSLTIHAAVFIHSFTMFRYVFLCELRGTALAVGSYSSGPPAEGNSPNPHL